MSEPTVSVNEWWYTKRWIFDGREIKVVKPAVQHMSIIGVTTIPEMGDYIADLHNARLEERE